jgi:hypothetical protein
VLLGRLVRLRARDADDVEPEVLRHPVQIHDGSVPPKCAQ